MTKLEIWESLMSIENAMIQAHVQLSNASAELENLKEAIRQDIAAENAKQVR